MPRSRVSLFLPLSLQQVQAACEGPETALAGLPVPALAAILLVQGLTGAAMTSDRLERLLAQLLELAVRLGHAAFAAQVAERFDPVQLRAGLALLDEHGLALLRDIEVEEADYLRPDGCWDFDFTARQHQRLQPLEVLACPDGSQRVLGHQQARLYRTFLVESDESMQVQGLAGVGKTHLIRAMVEALPAASTLILAFTGAQLEALRRRLGGLQVQGRTFQAMADELLTQDLTRPWRRVGSGRGHATYQVSDQQVARLLDIQPVAGCPADRVVGWCRQAIRAFCASTDARIGLHHFPGAAQPRTPAERALMVAHAERLWQETIRPEHPQLRMPVRGYHRIKQLALEPELRLPRHFTHVLIDESHDLPAPLLQFLGRCSQAVHMLGDVCQALHGRPALPVPQVRRRELCQSLRAGCAMESVVNPLLAVFPGPALAPLEGNRERVTRVLCYDQPQIPEVPTTILVNSEWGLFEWFQRLAKNGARFALLPGVEAGFRTFVQDCIELYHHGTPPRHFSLYRFGSWEALQQQFGYHRAFIRINDMLARGYVSADFERALMQMQPAAGAVILLGRVVDARNLEMDSVMLTPDLLTPLAGQDVIDFRRSLSAIYVGATRSRYQLMLPGHLRDWVSDQARRVAAPE